MIAVVIVNWNGRQWLDACLQAVARQTLPAGLVIVVDNSSTDGSVEHLRAVWPAVTVIALGTNAGVAAGNNAGIRRALEGGARHVLLLNNDAYMESDVLRALHDRLEPTDDGVWAAAPKIVFQAEPSRIWAAGGEMVWWKGLSRDRGNDELDRGQWERAELVDYANTCCLLVARRAFDAVGLMDEAYYMYFDDSDFCSRLGRAGGRIAYVPGVVVHHDVQASSRRLSRGPNHFMIYYTTRNRPRFIARNGPHILVRAVAHGFTIASRLMRMVQAWVRRDRRTAAVIWKGLLDGYVRRLTGPSSY